MPEPINEEQVEQTLMAFGRVDPAAIEELLGQLPLGDSTSLPESAGPLAGLTALGIAASFNPDPRVTRILLAQFLSSPNGAPGKRTPLMGAAGSGRADICQMLIEAGADLNIQNEHGFTALHIACYRGHVAVARTLIEAGACADIQTNDESTPLHFAVEEGHADVAWVVRSQSAIRAIDHADRRAFDLACEGPLRSDRLLLHVLDTGAIPGHYWTQITAIGTEENLRELLKENYRPESQDWMELSHDSPDCTCISDAETFPLNICMPDGSELFAVQWTVVTPNQPPTGVLVDDLSTWWEQIVFCVAYDINSGESGVGGFTIHAGSTAWDDHGERFEKPIRPTDEDAYEEFMESLDGAVARYKAWYLQQVLGRLEAGKPFGLEPLPWPAAEEVDLDAKGLESLMGHAALSESVTRLTIYNADRLIDLTGLDQCPQLMELALVDCPSLTSLEGLSSCTKLLSLFGEDLNSLTSLSGLQACTRLIQVDLDSADSLCDLGALSSCGRLRKLRLYSPAVQDLDFLAECKQIETLHIGSPSLKFIEALTSLARLSELCLSSCASLEDVGSLAKLEHLKHLDLSYCTSLKSVAALARSCSLELVIVTGCNSLSDFGSLPQMDRVAIYSRG